MYFQLRASLEGPAGQILWDAGKTHRVEDVIKLLRTRFGSEGQPERFRAELKAKRRHKGESLQSLYRDICRLVALAYPGLSSALLGIVGRDAFLDAVDDPALRLRILEWEPKDLDEALQLASRFEAHGRSFTSKEEADGEKEKFRGRQVRSVTSGDRQNDPDEPVAQLSRQIAELREALSRCQLELKQRFVMKPSVANEASVTQSTRPETAYVTAPWRTERATSAPQSGKSAGSGSVQSPHVGDVQDDSRVPVCYGCGQPGHIRRSCPIKKGKNG